jgi:uncharacterized protein YbjT (DUF2867 family)/ligand-binding SRPBCC domain-containing protein
VTPTVLLTGATGYIGGRLLRRFEEGGRPVRCLVRHPARLKAPGPRTDVVQGDCLDEASLDRALQGVETAYYLVHSMAVGSSFSEVDRRAAETFGRAAFRAGVRRIIYLGGLADPAGPLSAHLNSRAETGHVLRLSGVPVVEFRASIVVGAGSLSFEIIRALVERLPVMVCPRWVATPTQPIAIDDLLAYLSAAVDLPHGASHIFEIGGPEVVSYGEMMGEYAQLRGLRRYMLQVPLLTPHLSGLWLALVTPAQARVGRALVDGLRNATVVRSPAARDVFDVPLTPLRMALMKAIADDSGRHRRVDTRTIVVDAPLAQAFAPVRRIGGRTGWYFGNILWQARGWVDRCVGGVGMARGRRDPDTCAVGDAIDGWTVDAYEHNRRLGLAADMRLPGRGRLEFEVTALEGGRRSLIRQTATFDPRGLLGRVYWYAMLPVHHLMFDRMLARIARRASDRYAVSSPGTFVYRSIIHGRSDRVFRWHERPEALRALVPSSWLVRVESRTGGVKDGDVVRLSLGLAPVRLTWEARHYGYVPGKQFCDEQVRGPFTRWRHMHRFEPVGNEQCLYEDRVEYTVPGGALAQRLAHPVMRILLSGMFARRHQVVKASFADEHSGSAGRLGTVSW